MAVRQELPTSPPWQQPGFDLRLAPILAAAGVGAFVSTAHNMPGAVDQSVRLVSHNEVLVAGGILAVATGVLVLVAQRFAAPQRATSLFTTTAAASLAALGGFFALAAKLPGALPMLLTDPKWQGVALAGTLAWHALAVAMVRKKSANKLDPYPLAVLKQQTSYDYTLGEWHPDDWENAAAGPSSWLTWPEAGTYCSLLLLGLIGAGKTSQLMGSLMIQALGKFPDERDRQVSLLVIDRKGNQAADVYRWAKEMGREDDFRVVRPDVVYDDAGEPVIPFDRYASFSPLQGFDEPALLASELQDALESAKSQRSPDYFQNVQKEFLTHALTLLLAHDARTDLTDLQAFSAMDDVRKTHLMASTAPSLKHAANYFLEEFGKLSAQDQAALLRGLSSQLTLLTNGAVQGAFCPTRPNAHPALGSWQECLLEKPGIVVFSCPPALYTKGLSRLMALLFLKSFQRAMELRSDGSFAGNKTRPVALFADEAHYIFNQGLASFLAVSREARVVNVLATQTFSQIPPEYRAELMSGCRTHVLLATDNDTAKEYAESLGTITEITETVSFSEGFRPTASHHGATSASTSRGQSYNKRERPRFSPTALRHIPLGKGVAHVFDGKKLLPSCIFKTTPWYRLPFYLLDPYKHPLVGCRSGDTHTYERGHAGTLTCKSCQKSLTSQEASDYRAVLPALRAMKQAAASQAQGAGGA